VQTSNMWGAKSTPTIQHPPRVWKARGSLVLKQWSAAIQVAVPATVDNRSTAACAIDDGGRTVAAWTLAAPTWVSVLHEVA